jgi:hypothetical protein
MTPHRPAFRFVQNGTRKRGAAECKHNKRRCHGPQKRATQFVPHCGMESCKAGEQDDAKLFGTGARSHPRADARENWVARTRLRPRRAMIVLFFLRVSASPSSVRQRMSPSTGPG